MHTPHPDYVQFFPTLECNRRCGFCFNRGIAAQERIDAEDFKGLVCRISRIGIREIDILGGEPTLHPELDLLIDIALGNGLRANLSTNGSNASLLASLSGKYRKEVLKIGVSLNESTVPEDLHAYIVEHGPLIKSISKKGNMLPGHARRYLQMPGIRYYLLYMDAVARNDLAESMAFHEFLETLTALKGDFDNIDGVFCSGFIPDTPANPLLARVRCPAGTTKLSVAPDGSAYPCYLFFRHRDFRLGDLLHDDFGRIWGNPVLEYFRSYKGNNCPNHGSRLFSSCHGGCPAVSLLVCGDLDAPDPRCAAT
ncbi:MAG TPA: radical SAM/SPASM domain-containing protein [Dissulfurispiraceae bacterium]